MGYQDKLKKKSQARITDSIEPVTQPAEPAEPQPKPLKVSVVVVSHNRIDLLRRCLEALERSEARETMEILVVDNGSSDGSSGLDAEFPNARFVRLPRNFGLTKALNIGTRAADGEYVFFLHEDTEVAAGTVRELAARLDSDSDVTAVCPLLVTPEGDPAPQIGTFPPDNEWDVADVTGSEPIPVDYVRGAALMIRIFFLKAMRQIDEHYGQFGSDADVCFQIRGAGKKILLLPETRTVHHGGILSPMRVADFDLGVARFLGKYRGFLAGLKVRIVCVFSALFGFRFGELKYLLVGQKIDGTQM